MNRKKFIDGCMHEFMTDSLKKKSLSTIIHILKFPNNFKKVKLLLALLLPQSILEKKKEY